jgi:hypothetical protein
MQSLRRDLGESGRDGRTGQRSVTALALALASVVLFLGGFVFIGFYVESAASPHLGHLGVGFLTACAAFVVGCMIGLVVGIPRFVSSGAMRHDVERKRAAKSAVAMLGAAGQSTAATILSPDAAAQVITEETGPDETAAGQDAVASASQLSPSTNLAEISDWLTKLLLGAGLVELTRLGRPTANLIDAVARGLQGVPSTAKVQGTAVIVAGGILIMYLVLGFLDGYIVTTLWYGNYLEKLDAG